MAKMIAKAIEENSLDIPKVLIDSYCPNEFNMLHPLPCNRYCKECWKEAIKINGQLVKGYEFVLERESN